MQIASKPRIRRALRWAAGIFGTALIAMVVIHLPPVRAWLGAHGHHGGGVCPLGYGASTPASLEARRTHNAALRGDQSAHTRPALGFALDVTTHADIERWAAAHSIECADRHGAIECSNVPGALASGAESGAGELVATSLWFQFGTRGTLESIRTVRRDRSVGAVASAFAATEHALTAEAGPPASRNGSAAPDVLSNGTLRQATLDYRFADYRALVRATNMGDGFVLTEEYSTLID